MSYGPRCIWHDGSSINNHGHILFCVNVIYDPAVFYTSREYEEKFNAKVNVQSVIEAPELYIVGRCANNDKQLVYIETRISCLNDLKTSIQLGKSLGGIKKEDFFLPNL